jgi:CHAT domain-containing protein/tetratricopeptide (TPR) repeat protein
VAISIAAIRACVVGIATAGTWAYPSASVRAALSEDGDDACLVQVIPDTAATPIDPTELREAQAQRASQTAAQRVAYRFEARASATYLLDVSQEGLDFIVIVSAPDGSSRSFDSPLRRNGHEYVLLESVPAGPYTITIRSEEHTGATGDHSIRIVPVAAAAEDASVPVWRLISEGAELYSSRRSDEDLARSRSAYEMAAERAESSGLPDLHAYASFAVAMMDYWDFNAMAQAAARAEDVAGLYARLNEPLLSASAIHLEAAALIETTNSVDTLARALKLFDQAAATQMDSGQVYDLAQTINNIGLTYYQMGDWTNARREWQRAALMFREQDEFAGELLAIGNLGVIDLDEGFLTSAVESFERVLQLSPPGKAVRHRVDVLSNLAVAQRILNEFDAALQGFSCARALAEEDSYKWGFGWATAGIGETYVAMGRTDLAEEYLRAALPLEQEAGDVRGEAVVHHYLGDIERSKGNYAVALDHHRAALDATASVPDRILAQLDVARDLAGLGDPTQALAMLQDALAAAEESGSQLLTADARRVMGDVSLEAREYEQALQYLEPASDTYAALDMLTEQAQTLNAMAKSAQALGRYDDAIRFGDESVARVEEVRGRVSDPELRAFYLSARRDYFDLQIELLMHPDSTDQTSDATYLESALATSERSRARLTLDLLQRGVVDVAGEDSEISRRRTQLYRELAEQRYRRDVIVRSPAEEPRSGSLSSVLPSLAQVEHDLNLLETELRDSTSAQNAAGASTPPLDVRQMQDALDADSVLLQYQLGSEDSFVWVVKRDSVATARLPARETIDALARQVFADLSTFDSAAAARIQASARRKELADMVLGPILAHLDKRRLLVAADGALQYVPFGVLPFQDGDAPAQPLLQRYEIVGIPSLSTVVAQRKRRSGEGPSKTIAIFADPVLEPSDPRLANMSAASEEQGVDGVLSARSNLPLSRMPWTGREASAIAELVPATQRWVATGLDASFQAVTDADLDDYRILHFATHGIVDASYPDLSALVLSQFDRLGVPQRGLLELHDIYGLRLNAELVVLSACDTALGREVRAEGLLGLVQGFMSAGARGVVATLWPVADRATAELMTAFYDELLSGLPAADALRRAQQQIAQRPQWRDPFFWAAFNFIGDWR